MNRSAVFCAGVVLLAAVGVSYKLRTSAQTEKPISWHLIEGSSVGRGTLISSVGDDYKNLDECLKAWDRHKVETDRLNEGTPRSPEYQTTAYCIDSDTKQRINIQ